MAATSMDAVEFNKLHEKCAFEVDSLKRQLSLLKKVAKMEERLAMDALKLLGSSKSGLSIPSGEKISANVTAITEAKELGFRVRERYASKFIFEVTQAEGNLDSIVSRMKKITKENKRAADTISNLKKKVTAERESCMAQWNRLNEELTSSSKKSKLDKAQTKTSQLFKRLDERVAALNNTEKEHRQTRKDMCAVLNEIFECQRSMVKVTRTEAGDSIAAYSNALGELRVPLIRKVPSQKKLVDRYVTSLRVHNTNLPCTWSDVRQHRKPGDTHSVPKLRPPIEELEPKERRKKKREETGEVSDDSDSELHLESDAVFVDGLRSNWGERGAPQILSSANHADDQKSRARGRSRHNNDADADGSDADTDNDDAASRRAERSRRTERTERSFGSERSLSHVSTSRKSTRDRKRAVPPVAGSGQSQSMRRSPGSRANSGSNPEPISLITRSATTRPQPSNARKPTGGSASAHTAPSSPHQTLSRSQTSPAARGETGAGLAAWSTSSRRKRPNGNPFRPPTHKSTTPPSHEGVAPLDLSKSKGAAAAAAAPRKSSGTPARSPPGDRVPEEKETTVKSAKAETPAKTKKAERTKKKEAAKPKSDDDGFGDDGFADDGFGDFDDADFDSGFSAAGTPAASAPSPPPKISTPMSPAVKKSKAAGTPMSPAKNAEAGTPMKSKAGTPMKSKAASPMSPALRSLSSAPSLGVDTLPPLGSNSSLNSAPHDDPFAGLAVPDDDDDAEFEDLGNSKAFKEKSNGGGSPDVDDDFASFDSFKGDADWGGFDDF